MPLDPTCAESLVCWASPFGVFRTADAFLVLYFATRDPMGPSPTTELRMVRLIPAP